MMPVNKEACSLLAETIGIILGEFADEPPEMPHKNMIFREAEYLAKKAWTRASIAGHIAVKYGGSSARRVPLKRVGARPPSKKRKTVQLDENGWVEAWVLGFVCVCVVFFLFSVGS